MRKVGQPESVKARQAKQGMMSVLLTGRVRLVESHCERSEAISSSWGLLRRNERSSQ